MAIKTLALSLFLVLVLPQSCGAQDADDRIAREARALFDVVIGDKTKLFAAPVARCRLDAEWFSAGLERAGQSPTFAIPEDLAREFLGVRFHGQVVAPEVALFPKDILDPQGENAAAFCSTKEREAYAGEQKALVASGKAPPRPLMWSSFSFPVFDDHFATAILIDFQTTELKGKTNWTTFLICHATVYKKTNGTWRPVKSEEICIS